MNKRIGLNLTLKDLAFMTILILLSLSVVMPKVAYATNDDQSPNRQITTTNTKGDPGWWERFSIRTNTTFSIATSAFTFQLNAYTDGCGTYGNCVWWNQAITGIDAGSLVGKSGGYWLHDAHLEPFYGSTAGGDTGDLGSHCALSIPELVNIDNYGFNVMIQLANGTSGVTFTVGVSDQANSTNFYTVSKTCSIGSGTGQIPYPIDYAYQVEGIIAGCGSSSCGTNVSFSPLHENIFGGYIDLVSNYNVMSSANKSSQSGEGSNLYQVPSTGGYYGESYGSMYLYTVVSSEFYYGTGGEVTKSDS